MTNSTSTEALLNYFRRIETLENEKAEIHEHIKDVYADAKASGFDPKIMRKIASLMKMAPEDRNEQESLLSIYKDAVGIS